MKSLREYEELIKERVKKINDEDPNWKWSIKEFTDTRVSIRWGYLDYCGEKDNCFFLSMTTSDEDNEYFITSRTPDDHMIDGNFSTEIAKEFWTVSFETAIEDAIDQIASFAHSRY